MARSFSHNHPISGHETGSPAHPGDHRENATSPERIIGIGGVAFTAFNAIVGMGIFGLPGIIAGTLGPAAIFAYLACLLLVCLVGLCFAEAGSRVDDHGGIYAYARVAFGSVTGGVAGVLIVFANTIASCAALVRLALDVVSAQYPIFASPLIAFGTIAALYVLLAAINIRGARQGTRLTFFITIIKIAPLVALIACGIWFIQPANLRIQALPSVKNVSAGTLMLFFAFIGVENGSYLSGETRDAARVMPRAILMALVMVSIIYVGLQIVPQGVLGKALANAPAPLLDTARAMFGPAGSTLLFAATVLSALGFMVTDMLSSPRVVFALARAGQLPRWLGLVHPVHHTPRSALIVYPIAVLVVAASGTFRQIALLSTAGTLILYLIVCASVLRLRARDVAQAGTPFRLPGGASIPLLAIAIILWLLSTLSWREMVLTSSFVIASALIYGGIAIRQTWRQRKQGQA